MPYRLEPRLGQGLAQALRDWCEGLGAKGAKLVIYPPGEPCPCQPEAQAANNRYRSCVVNGPCPLQAAHPGNILGQSPHLPPTGGEDGGETSLCLSCRLASGEILALHGAGPALSATTLGGATRQTALASPLLLWAKAALERHALQELLEETHQQYRADRDAAIRAQEDERERLALEVHDRLAQTLASVFQQLQGIEALARALPEIRQAAVRGSILCRDAIRETRNIMNDLRPPVLEELGLAPLVQEELDHLEKEGCRVVQRLNYRVRPSREIELVLYRVFHEALINIRRHAKATLVTVSLDADHDVVRLEVADNGVGFEVADAASIKKVGGLMSMERRAELAGGSCRIESQRGHGTRVQVQVPMAGVKPFSRQSHEG